MSATVRQIVFTGLLLALCTAMPRAHHAASAMYDNSRTVAAIGTITRVVLKNPHSLLYFTESGPAERAIEWQVEMGPTAQLARAGWTAERLKPGTRIRVTGRPARAEGTHGMCCAQIVRLDGSPINPERPSNAAP